MADTETLQKKVQKITNRAKTRLVHEFNDEFRRIMNEEAEREGLRPAVQRTVTKWEEA